jgi:hypothetical protein
MPTTPKSIEGVVAVSDGSITPLGYLCWFSVPDDNVGLRVLRTTLAKHGLPPSLAPKDTKAINVFKRAMREQEGRKRNNGHITETDVVQVEETPDHCIYQLSRVTRDLEEKEVDYPKAAKVTFSKQTNDIAFQTLGGVPRGEMIAVEEEIQEFFDRNSTRVTGAKVRGIVRNYIKDQPDEQRNVEGLSGENLRGKAGGIYFVPAKHQDQVEALSEFLHELYKGRGYLHAVPLADSASERELVRRHHVANTLHELTETVSEVGELSRGERDRAVRSDVIANHWSKYRAMQRRSVEYAALLQDEQEDIAAKMRVLEARLQKLT